MAKREEMLTAIFKDILKCKLASVNVRVFEYEVDENGNTHEKVWEWE